MGLIAVPNVSEGRNRERIGTLLERLSEGGARVVDVHSDEVHDRSVFTVAGSAEVLIEAMRELACAAAQAIDLSKHHGIHPRLGCLDVCPVVAHDAAMEEAIAAARGIARGIAERCRLPVYLYGAAALRDATRELPDIRRGGLDALIRRANDDLPPDLGPSVIDPKKGVVCVGARDVLIAFNVWVRSDGTVAREMAKEVRDAARGLRALGLEIEDGVSQVSMNLTQPEVVGIDDAFELVEEVARRSGVEVIAGEIVGVPPRRYMPDPQRKAARLLKRPGRSLESVLA